MPFTEFYCNSGSGSNLYGGSPVGGPYPLSFGSGAWVNTGVFTVGSGNPLTSIPTADITAGNAFAHITNGVSEGFIARILSATSTTITVSLTACSGSVPGNSTRTCWVGGPWKGPNGANQFPFNYIGNLAVNVAGDPVRINFADAGSYSCSSGVSSTGAGPIHYQGYHATPGDGGRATFSTGSANVNGVVFSNSYITLADWIILQAPTSTATTGVAMNGVAGRAVRVAVSGAGGIGISLAAADSLAEECEVYNCGGLSASGAGVSLGSSTMPSCIRCYSHGNVGVGYLIPAASRGLLSRCIADSNSGAGIASAGVNVWAENCDFYNNAGGGLSITGTAIAIVHLENCNFFANGGYGVNLATSARRSGEIINCCFGQGGGYANTSGNYTGLDGVEVVNPILHPANTFPWQDPANGDFRIASATCRGAGRAAFLQTAAGKAGTVGYADIGAAQHQDAGGGVSRGRMVIG